MRWKGLTILFLVDTNVLIFAAFADCSEHRACRKLLDSALSAALPWFVTWGILYEFLRVATHPRVPRQPLGIHEAWSFVADLLGSPGFTVLTETDRHAEVAARVLQEVPLLRGNILHDAHTAILMREHGIRRIYTRHTDFHRFPFLEVIDPLRASGNGG